jgi:ATP-dependent protease ClpP protease subunit
VLDEINQTRNSFIAQGNAVSGQLLAQANAAQDVVRRKYLALLHEKTERNVIAYYSGFLSKTESLALDINDEDKNGFMAAVHQLDRKKGLDLILHTPGGRIAATQSIVNYLQKMFKGDIRAIVPQIAMSAGTMIACSCHTIMMGTHSNLGPIDPQLRGLPAYGVLEEFKRAMREIKKDPSKIAVWQPIIGKYYPTFISECENAIKWSNEFVLEQLQASMFYGDRDAKEKATKIVRSLTAYRVNKGHSRHVHFEDCQNMGLKVEKIESDPEFQSLLLTVHHCYMHALMNTPSFKMIENHKGIAFVKMDFSGMIAIQQQLGQPIRSGPVSGAPIVA